MSSSFVEYPVEVYSTLEYNGSKLGQSSRHWSAETPQHADQLGIQVAIAEGPQTVQDDTPKLVRVASSPTSHILANESAIPGDPLESEEEPPSLSEHASFLGRSRRFWMIFGGIIIVIAAVIGGTVGGVLGSRHSSLTSNDATYSPAPSATSSPAVTNFNKYIHVDSNITATNFTDKAGYTYRAIFFQDTTSALIGCIWNSQNKTWNTLNITQITTGLRLDPGSPLTTTAKSIGSGQIFIWGFLQGNTIYQYSWYGDGGATDPAEDSWSGDSVNTATVKPYAGSHLASSWYRPVDFTGNDTEFLMMMYQANSGEMMLFFRNSTQIMVPATLGTSLAMGLQFNTEFGPACIFTFESSPSILLQPYYFLPSMGMSMGLPNLENPVVMGNIPEPTYGLHLADGALMNDLFLHLALLPNGTVAGTVSDSEYNPTSLPDIAFLDGPENVNFSAITMTSDQMFYGIWNDTIYEYAINGTTPEEFTYQGTVYP